MSPNCNVWFVVKSVALWFVRNREYCGFGLFTILWVLQNVTLSNLWTVWVWELHDIMVIMIVVNLWCCESCSCDEIFELVHLRYFVKSRFSIFVEFLKLWFLIIAAKSSFLCLLPSCKISSFVKLWIVCVWFVRVFVEIGNCEFWKIVNCVSFTSYEYLMFMIVAKLWIFEKHVFNQRCGFVHFLFLWSHAIWDLL
jgi:hypothetical protein